MTNGLNKVFLAGHVGQDPELKTFESGNRKLRFSLATSESFNNKEGERVTKTEWHNIVCWNNSADFGAKWIKKGKPLLIEGKLRTNSYKDKEGNSKFFTEIDAENFTLLDKKESNANGKAVEMAVASDSTVAYHPDNDSDLPF